MHRAARSCWQSAVAIFGVAWPLLITSCAPVPHAYPGPRRAESEVASLRAMRGKIIEVDGIAYFASRIELLPGEHEVVATFLLRGEDFAPGVRDEDVARIDCVCRGTMMPGSRYRLELERSQPIGRSSGLVVQYLHRIRLVDEADGRFYFLHSDCDWRR